MRGLEKLFLKGVAAESVPHLRPLVATPWCRPAHAWSQDAAVAHTVAMSMPVVRRA